MVKQSGIGCGHLHHHVLMISTNRNQLMRSSSSSSSKLAPPTGLTNSNNNNNQFKLVLKTCLILSLTIWMIYQLKFSISHTNYPRRRRTSVDDSNKSSGTGIGHVLQGKEEREGEETTTARSTVKLGRKGIMGSSSSAPSADSYGKSERSDQYSIVSKMDVEDDGVDDVMDGSKGGEEEEDELIEDDGEDDDDNEDEEDGEDDDDDEVEVEQLEDTTEEDEISSSTNPQSIENDDLSD